MLALYELNDHDEATGRVYFFCSEIHREVFRSNLGAHPHAPGENTDALAGTVCDQCGTVLEDKEASTKV